MLSLMTIPSRRYVFRGVFRNGQSCSEPLNQAPVGTGPEETCSETAIVRQVAGSLVESNLSRSAELDYRGPVRSGNDARRGQSHGGGRLKSPPLFEYLFDLHGDV